MNCLDTSAIVDYLEGEEAIGQYLREREDEPFFAPTVVLQEVFVGAARLEGADGIRRVREDIGWIESIPLTTEGAAEAAIIDAELHEAGHPIGAMDTTIAGVVREVGGTVVTNDEHFERVPDLDVERYEA